MIPSVRPSEGSGAALRRGLLLRFLDDLVKRVGTDMQNVRLRLPDFSSRNPVVRIDLDDRSVLTARDLPAGVRILRNLGPEVVARQQSDGESHPPVFNFDLIRHPPSLRASRAADPPEQELEAA